MSFKNCTGSFKLVGMPPRVFGIYDLELILLLFFCQGLVFFTDVGEVRLGGFWHMYVYMSITVFWQLTTCSFVQGVVSDCKTIHSWYITRVLRGKKVHVHDIVDENSSPSNNTCTCIYLQPSIRESFTSLCLWCTATTFVQLRANLQIQLAWLKLWKGVHRSHDLQNIINCISIYDERFAACIHFGQRASTPIKPRNQRSYSLNRGFG